MSCGAFVAMALLALVWSVSLCLAGSWGGLLPDQPDDLLSNPTSGSALLDRWNSRFTGLGPKEETCQKITDPIGQKCKRFAYTHTIIPNLLNHDSQGEAGGRLRSYQLDRIRAVLNETCAEEFLFLLCTYHFTPCSRGLVVPISACSGFCRRVQAQCLPQLLKRGIKWPATIDCNELLDRSYINPKREIAHVCVNSVEALSEATSASPVVRAGPDIPERPEEPGEGWLVSFRDGFRVIRNAILVIMRSWTTPEKLPRLRNDMIAC